MIRHRAKHTVPVPSWLLPPLRAHPTHMLDVPVRETRSACHCLARRALDLPQHIEHSPDFLSVDRVKKRGVQIFRTGRKEKKIRHLQYAWYTQDMSFVGHGVTPIHSHPSVRVYVLEEMGNETDPVSHPSLPIRSPPPPLGLLATPRARSSALSKFADGQRTPRGLCSSGLESEILIF